MKLEVGMYVRTIEDKAVGNGIIGKIKYINEREFKGKLKKYYSVWTNNEDWFEILESNIIFERVKASNDIIDLIEPLDLMYIDIDPNDESGGIIVPRIAETLEELERWKKRLRQKECKLVYIITHEQIGNRMYKVI